MNWQAIGIVTQAALTVIIGGTTVLIAIRQWLTARDKLKIDLFDRRLEVWRRYLKFYDDCQWKPEAGEDWVERFLKAIEPARFLFGPEIHDFLYRLAELALVRTFAIDTFWRREGADRLPRDVVAVHEAEDEAREQVIHEHCRQAVGLFTPYLSFDHLHGEFSEWLQSIASAGGDKAERSRSRDLMSRDLWLKHSPDLKALRATREARRLAEAKGQPS